MVEEELYRIDKYGKSVDNEEHSRILYRMAEIRPELPFREDSTPYTWDEQGMGDLFGDLYTDTCSHCIENRTWYTYDGTCWAADIDGSLVSIKLKEFSRLLELYAADIEDKDTREAYIKFIKKMGDRRYRERILKDAADVLAIHASEFDKDPYLINLENGTYDLRTMSFREHDPADLLTRKANVSYTLQRTQKDDERWVRFIAEVTQSEEKALYLQKALGYSLLGKAYEDCMFVLYGATSRNGKSTLLAAVKNILGDYAGVAPVEMICNNGSGRTAEAPSPVLASLRGRRFVTMAESSQSGRIDESLLKQLTSCEEITARELHGKPMTFVPQFVLWLSCNDLPALRDRSVFASDRIRVISFDRHFSPEEQDKSLGDYFREKMVKRGIFHWLLEGYKLYKAEGLVMSPALKAVGEEYARENDIILQFLEARTKLDPEGKVKGKVLYETYKLWAKSNGYGVLSIKKFTSEMRAHAEYYSHVTKPNNLLQYNGMSLV